MAHRTARIFKQHASQSTKTQVFESGITQCRQQFNDEIEIMLGSGYHVVLNQTRKDTVTLTKWNDTVKMWIESDAPEKRATGGGRKPIGHTNTIKTTITILPQHLEMLKQWGDGNASEGVRKMVDFMEMAK